MSSSTTSTADTLALAFMGLNVSFLLLTAVMFRLQSLPSGRTKFADWLQETLLADLQWQYSLRSNLLVVVVVLSSYLIYLREIGFLMVCYCGVSVMNVLTDCLVPYDDAPVFPIARKGHRIAGIVIVAATMMWWSSERISS